MNEAQKKEFFAKHPGRMAARLLDGYDWNPLLTIGRNEMCPCDSGKKFKRCHLNTMPRAIPADLAKQYRAGMKNPGGFKFETDEVPDEKDSKPVL